MTDIVETDKDENNLKNEKEGNPIGKKKIMKKIKVIKKVIKKIER